MKRILITGIAGLIGSNLARWIRNFTDDEVLGIDDLSCGLLSNIPHDTPWYRMRLGVNECEFDELVSHWKPDVVYHCAAYAAEGLSPFIREYNYRNNLVATAEVVNACINHQVTRLVFTSSMAVYGCNTPPFDESYQCCPIDPYGVAKFACEQDIRIAGEQHGLDWVIIRPHNVYGPGQVCTQQYRNVIGIWMDRYLHGQTLRIYGDGLQMRAFSYIDDCVAPLYVAGQSGSASREIINLGGTVPVTIGEMATQTITAMGGGEVEYCEPRHEVKLAWSTYRKSVDLLQYEDKTSFQDGLSRMWDWASTHEQVRAETPDIEIFNGLPSYWRGDLKAVRYGD